MYSFRTKGFLVVNVIEQAHHLDTRLHLLDCRSILTSSAAVGKIRMLVKVAWLRVSLQLATGAAAVLNGTDCVWHVQSGGGASTGAIAVLQTGKKMRARCLIGTDGANSRVARALNVPKPNYAGYAAYRLDAHCHGRHSIQSSTVSTLALVFELPWYVTLMLASQHSLFVNVYSKEHRLQAKWGDFSLV